MPPVEEWSRLYRITDRIVDPWYDSSLDRPGLYGLIGLTDATVPTTATLQRVCGSDLSGTVYIGSTGNLRPRVGALVMQHDRERFRGGGHKPLPARLAADFPPDRLALRWRYLPQDVDRYAEERRLITAYTDTFGEPPSLNAMP